MSSISGAAGLAALAICESMLLSLTDNKIIDAAEARAILADAAAAHRNATPLLADGAAHGADGAAHGAEDGAAHGGDGAAHEADGAAHEEAAALIEAILKGGNSVRRA